MLMTASSPMEVDMQVAGEGSFFLRFELSEAGAIKSTAASCSIPALSLVTP